MVLVPGLTRHSGVTRHVAVPAAAVTLRLQLEMDRPLTAGDRAVVRDVDGTAMWSQAEEWLAGLGEDR